MKKIPSKTFLSLVFFFLSLKIWFIEVLVAQNTATIPVNVGVVLDLEFSGGNIDLTCINMALSDFYATHSDYKTRLVLTTRNSGNDVVRAAAAGSLSDPSFLSNC
jgi:ionotropic glutamate receptor